MCMGQKRTDGLQSKGEEQTASFVGVSVRPIILQKYTEHLSLILLLLFLCLLFYLSGNIMEFTLHSTMEEDSRENLGQR